MWERQNVIVCIIMYVCTYKVNIYLCTLCHSTVLSALYMGNQKKWRRSVLLSFPFWNEETEDQRSEILAQGSSLVQDKAQKK